MLQEQSALEKICVECKVSKLLSDFDFNDRSKDK